MRLYIAGNDTLKEKVTLFCHLLGYKKNLNQKLVEATSLLER